MKNMVCKNLVFLIALLSGGVMFSQITVTGTVSDASGPIPGVNVSVKGTSSGTTTDFDGNYELSDIAEDATIVYSFIGFATQEIPVNGQTAINVTLSEDNAELDAVVLVGYGSSVKKDLTTAVVTLKAEDFNRGVQTSPDQLIQGRVSGVNITQSSGEPGAGANIRVRGNSTFRAGNDPLIVLDGVPLTDEAITPSGGAGGAEAGLGSSSPKNPLNFINPADIQSINVLKDASATAIYGSRGANGVILIATKKGRSGKPQMSFSASTSFATLANDYDRLDTNEFIAAANAIGRSDLNQGSSSDALDEITREAITQNYHFDIAGGSDTGNYRFSMGLLDQEGIIKNSGQQRYNVFGSFSEKVFNDKLKIDAKVLSAFVKDERVAIADDIGASGDLLSNALRWNPTRSLRQPDTGAGPFLQPDPATDRNPLALLEYYDDDLETFRLFGAFSAEYEIVSNLKYKFNMGIDRSEATSGVAVSRLLNATNFIGNGYASNSVLKTFSKLFEHTLSYDTYITDNFSLDAVVGYSFQQFQSEGFVQEATNFGIDDQSRYLDNLRSASSFPLVFAANVANTSFNNPTSELQSFFGRVNLGLYDKYLLTATLRADGSSRFGSGNEYGYFPSAAFAWKIINESFMPVDGPISDLKFRVGWGITGNQAFPAGSAQDQFSFERTVDANNNPITIVSQQIAGNPDLQWETSTTLNIGLDFGFLDGRISGVIDYFNKKTEDVLFRLPATQPAVPNSFFWRNLENTEIINSGIEFGISADVIKTDDLVWDVSVNMSFLDNKVKSVTSDGFAIGIQTGAIGGPGLSEERAQLIFDDQPINAFYLPVFEGLDASGNPIFADVNGDGVVNTSNGAPGEVDRAFVGDPNPDILVGFRTGVSYKSFDASLFMNGAYGHDIYDNTANALFNANRFTSGTGNNVTQDVAAGAGNDNSIGQLSTRYLKSGDFLRLSNVTLGYTLESEKLGEKMGKWFESLRVYVSGQNLFVITPYDGFDPEVNTNKGVDGVSSFGIDFTSYPRARQFTLGMNMNF